jgi:osmotically-inducible protein OsmY
MTRAELKRLVQEELKWDPSIDHASIGVEVSDESVVTVSGHVQTYTQKLAAEKAAKKVRGVTAVANDVEIRLLGIRDDTTIAEACTRALFLNSSVPQNRIKMEGDVEWEYQKRAAERVVREIPGVRGVTNLASVQPTVKPVEIKEKIRAAFERNALVDAGHVQVVADGSTVILTGAVQSWQERTEAERQAWAAPGVATVQNKLTVQALVPAL